MQRSAEFRLAFNVILQHEAEEKADEAEVTAIRLVHDYIRKWNSHPYRNQGQSSGASDVKGCRGAYCAISFICKYSG